MLQIQMQAVQCALGLWRLYSSLVSKAQAGVQTCFCRPKLFHEASKQH